MGESLGKRQRNDQLQWAESLYRGGFRGRACRFKKDPNWCLGGLLWTSSDWRTLGAGWDTWHPCGMVSASAPKMIVARSASQLRSDSLRSSPLRCEAEDLTHSVTYAGRRKCY